MGKIGEVVVEGIAIGRLQWIKEDYREKLKYYVSGSAEEEMEKCRKAYQDVCELLADSMEKEGDLLEAYQLMLQDPIMHERIRDYIVSGQSAPMALMSLEDSLNRMFDKMDDPYIQERRNDVIDLRNYLMRNILETSEPEIAWDETILYGDSISPAMIANLTDDKIKAIILKSNSSTSHTIVLARENELITMIGVELDMDQIHDGDMMIVDAVRGKILTDPTQEEITRYRKKQSEYEQIKKRLLEKASAPARTQDGRMIQIAANLGDSKEITSAMERGAVGVGLFRTELLYMKSDHLPSVEELKAHYEKVIEGANGEQCLFRTLDIGGDKHCAGITMKQERNPFLGVRGIRLCLEQPDIFKDQLSALLQAALKGPTGIMLPMVSTIDEVKKAKRILEEVKLELDKAGLPYSREVLLGIMIETPSVAIMAKSFAKYVDFVSVGTNDLAQYVLAADRTNSALDSICDYFEPAVLHNVHWIYEACKDAGIEVSLCGEMASDTTALPFLLEVGYSKLSMSPVSIPKVKEQIRKEHPGRCSLKKVLAMETAQEVRAYLETLKM